MADYAARCKYCDYEITRYAPVETAGTAALLCPTCGGSLPFDGMSPTAVCPHCGNAVAVPSRAVPRAEAAIPPDEEDLPLSEQVEHLLRDGRPDRAIPLLRRHLSIQEADAERIVAIMESGNYGDAKRLFDDAMHGKLKGP